MEIVMISNYLNHHQEPLARAMNCLEGVKYSFVAVAEMEEERKQLGYSEYDQEKYPYLVYYKQEPDRAQLLIDNADVVIIGSADYKLLAKRIEAGQLTFVYTERIFKNMRQVVSLLVSGRWYSTYAKTGKYPNTYTLCASSYVPHDFKRIGAFGQKLFKWGYFPEFKRYHIENSIKKATGVYKFLWVGRLIGWKHPDYAIDMIKELVSRGIPCELKIVGVGPEERNLKKRVESFRLEKYCSFLGAMHPDEIRSIMEQSDIFLFTSDRNEGWGAVLNEAMNSYCCVIANSEAGATNYLVKDRYNGLIYKHSKKNLLQQVLFLMSKPELIDQYKIHAYRTVADCWNPDVAAKRFVGVCKELLQRERLKDCPLFDDGPMSKA